MFPLIMFPLISQWCVRHLGSEPVERIFGIQRLSAVHGLRLADGREVVVKVRGAAPRQAACAQVHAAMWAAGVPCPQPLIGPLPLAEGTEPVQVAGEEGPLDARALAADAESWEGEGYQAVGPGGASWYAVLLARMVAAAPDPAQLSTLQPPVPWLNWDHGDPARTWPPPFSPRWDPHRIDSEIPALVHETARRTRARLLRPDAQGLPLVAGHGDFEAQNCRWVEGAGGPRFVIHDWDSVVAMPEAVLAGNSAATYTSETECELPSLAQSAEFLTVYEQSRGRTWSPLEVEVAYAAGAWVAAYNAAFEHLKGGPGHVTDALSEQWVERLRLAGA